MSNDISIHISALAEGYGDKRRMDPEEFERLLAPIARINSRKSNRFRRSS